MIKQFDEFSRQISPEDWYLEFTPAEITVLNMKTEHQVREPSLTAVVRSQPGKLAAVGKDALPYRDNPDYVVFSPFRRGQVAHYSAA
ncbi:hypothetical protein D1641_00055 [Colidextribacter sp. OB.20]|uniref:hypothetical protein n=1 Tax=Colidextribacter sp. OB.20 TaxID=2304568 RepID=UPI00136B2C9A|nr:hypothetical protein [Colidextribacter sp. OB.20]NBI08415.1 hypothetical protein [Colidextribacter sp. OB.20]